MNRRGAALIRDHRWFAKLTKAEVCREPGDSGASGRECSVMQSARSRGTPSATWCTAANVGRGGCPAARHSLELKGLRNSRVTAPCQCDTSQHAAAPPRPAARPPTGSVRLDSSLLDFSDEAQPVAASEALHRTTTVSALRQTQTQHLMDVQARLQGERTCSLTPSSSAIDVKTRHRSRCS